MQAASVQLQHQLQLLVSFRQYREHMPRERSSDPLPAFVGLDDNHCERKSPLPKSPTTPSTADVHTSNAVHTNPHKANRVPTRVASEWRRDITRVRPLDPPRFNLEGESDADATVRKKYTLVLRHLQNGDVMTTDAHFPNKYESLADGVPLIGAELVVEEGCEFTNEEKAQSAFGWGRYSLIKNGTPFDASRATIRRITAMKYGYANVHTFVSDVVAPYLSSLGISIRYSNSPAADKPMQVRVSMLDGFKLAGDTMLLNQLLKFRNYGLKFIQPYWVPVDSSEFDFARLLAALKERNTEITSPDGSVSDDLLI